jgi:hypothetical protein
MVEVASSGAFGSPNPALWTRLSRDVTSLRSMISVSSWRTTLTSFLQLGRCGTIPGNVAALLLFLPQRNAWTTVDPKPLARFDSSPPVEMAVLPSTSTVLAPPEASNKPAKKARKSRSDDGRRGVIRTMQDCYKKVLRFVKSDIAGTIASSCSQTDCLVRCENSPVLSAWRGEEDSHSVECCRG